MDFTLIFSRIETELGNFSRITVIYFTVFIVVLVICKNRVAAAQLTVVVVAETSYNGVVMKRPHEILHFPRNTGACGVDFQE